MNCKKIGDEGEAVPSDAFLNVMLKKAATIMYPGFTATSFAS